MEAEERLIFALDVTDFDKAVSLLDKLEETIKWVKVNSLAAAFPEIIEEIKQRKMKVWRDWKHHDIPGTVKNFIIADILRDIDMTTVHILGGKKMLEYAVETKKEFNSNIKILGITILTSHDQKSFNEELGFPGMIEDKVFQLASLAREAGLDGVVCSAKELEKLSKIKELLKVTPGIKPIWAVKREDQARVVTPKKAILKGADYIVVGSAIHKSPNPKEAAEKIVAEIESALEVKE